MTGRRRHSSLRAVAWFVPAVVLLTVLGAAEAVLRHPAGQVAAMMLLPIAGYGLGRWHSRRCVARPKQQPDRLPPSAELARLRDDNAKLQVKVRVLSDMINGERLQP